MTGKDDYYSWRLDRLGAIGNWLLIGLGSAVSLVLAASTVVPAVLGVAGPNLAAFFRVDPSLALFGMYSFPFADWLIDCGHLTRLAAPLLFVFLGL